MRPGAYAGRRLAVGFVLAAAALTGCTPAAVQQAEPPPVPATSSGSDQPGPEAVPSAREGKPAQSTRITFIPAQVTLPGGAHAVVEPARTVDGELKVPENVRHVGWWDGSAYVGDPFGTTVIAGHVDSATEGVGYFARLLKIKVGDVVTVSADGHHLSYRVSSVQTVAKRALAADSRAFDQTGDHRLVLITCAGNYRADRGGYDSNLVVMARPLGLAK